MVLDIDSNTKNEKNMNSIIKEEEKKYIKTIFEKP
jgi:hypothetical protein